MKRLLVCALVMLTPALAFAGPPQQFLDAQVKAVRALLAQKAKAGTPQAAEMDQKLMAIVDPVMEFDGLSARALKSHWPSLKDQQKAEFVSLFRELVFRSYLKRVRSANEDYTIVYEGQEQTGPGKASVTAIAKTKKVEIELVFHLESRPGGKWIAGDIVIDEVSITGNYREQFNKIIKKDGFAGLLKKMRDKLKDLGGAPAPAPAAPKKK